MENLKAREQKAFKYWMQGHYDCAAELYEQLLSIIPDNHKSYGYLGLMRLLEGKPAEAQLAWDALSQNFSEEGQTAIVQFISVLQAEAARQKAIDALEKAAIIRDTILSFAEQLRDRSSKLENQAIGYHLTIKTLLETGGNWQIAFQVYQEYQHFLNDLVDLNPTLDQNFTSETIVSLSFAPYFIDDPAKDHQFRNKFAQFYQDRIFQSSELCGDRKYLYTQYCDRSNVNPSKKLRIGYVSSCFYRHSVGWIVRWLLKYHRSEQFELFAYSLMAREDDLTEYIARRLSKFVNLSQHKFEEIAAYVAQDELDILVDLDSITHRLSSPVFTLKPAPIQVSWLGWDASGLPNIDYFIADPYVLPSSAQTYYRAKIWQLPNIYVAVDGFEVGLPTIRRDCLQIPEDAVVYLSSQMGYKRNPENARLQLRILKHVENSFFVIKSLGDEQLIREFFESVAAAEGVESDRLRFLPPVNSEEIHRANLAIADVVLDTYPYNGATTTLETLWMGIPLVTRVGEQFAARNSYTMMVNAGVPEGIAWSDREYFEWGIRLGKDANLRQEISWRLRRSRHTSPLWNAEQFTREMERAYQEMWVNYIREQSSL
jgi:predicted O-linked N-acetylglucosamine transferase (SPINDLY family)